jgi:hypothetical protein
VHLCFKTKSILHTGVSEVEYVEYYYICDGDGEAMERVAKYKSASAAVATTGI